MSVVVSRVDVGGLDLPLAAELAEIDNAALDGVPLRHHTAQTFLAECHDRGGEGPDAGVWLAHDDDRLVGYAALTLNAFENLDGAKILGAVHPRERRRGIGRRLLAAAEAATDRPRLRAPAWAGTAGEHALPRLGYAATSSHEVRRLRIHDPQPAALTTAAGEAARDFDLERFTGACPEGLMADMQLLREAINDAPEPGEWEAYPPERIRGYEESLSSRGWTTYTVVARHRASGRAAGLSMLCVHEPRPRIAAQEDTSVLEAYRGHRLGLWMKLSMLAWLRAERPDVEYADTWNAAGNAPMIAINDALGCHKVAETLAFRKLR